MAKRLLVSLLASCACLSHGIGSATLLPGAVFVGSAPSDPIVLDETGPTAPCATCGSVEVFFPVVIPFAPQQGALIIGEGQLPTLGDSSTWGDVVLFTAGPEREGKTAQLYSDNPLGNPWSAALETLVKSYASESVYFVVEGEPTIYQPDQEVTYQIISDDEGTVPEPATLVLFSIGLAGFVFSRRPRNR